MHTFMIRMYVILFICFELNSAAYAQKEGEDVIYLKDNKTIRGIIIEQIPFKTIKVVTGGKDTLVLSVENVLKIERLPLSKLSVEKDGYINARNHIYLETGYTVSIFDSYSNIFRLNLITDFLIKPGIYLGAGAGIRYDPDHSRLSPAFNNTGLPIFIEIRNFFPSRRSLFFLAIDLGYSFDFYNDPYLPGYSDDVKYSLSDIKDIGFLNCIRFGLCFNSSARSAINLGIDLESQFYENYWQYKTPKYRPTIGIGINAGISF